MSNMSYCRFENTLTDLRDCHENINEPVSSDEESQARLRLIQVCQDIVDEAEEEFGSSLHDLR